MRKLAIVLGVVVILAGAAAIGWRVYSGPAAPAPKVNLGETVSEFTLQDLNGQPVTLASLRGEKGTLLIFIATKCPYSNGSTSAWKPSTATMPPSASAWSASTPTARSRLKKSAATLARRG